MKKVIAFIIFTATAYVVKAQTTDEENQITDVRIEIMYKLNTVVKNNWNADMDGKTLSSWEYVKDIPNNKALIEFSFKGNPKGGIYEMDYRYSIDFTKIRNVSMGKSNGGTDGFFFFAEDQGQAILEYKKNHDWTVGDWKYRNNEWVDQAPITMPQDQELLDLFLTYIKLVKADKKLHPENYGTLPEPKLYDNVDEIPLTPQAQATLDAFDAVSVLFGNFWEISGTASFTNPVSYQPGNYNYTPTKAYELNDARFVFVYGEKNFTFNLGVGFSWMSLPSYRKYNSSGSETAYTDFGTVKYISPSIGVTYKFISQKNKSDFYRNIEFPLTVSFAPLFGGKTKKVTIKNEAYDTEFSHYFEGLCYNINASIGANMYFGKGFGIGVSAGGTYVNIKATKEKITETINNTQSSFTIKMDDLSPIIPRAEVKLIFRL